MNTPMKNVFLVVLMGLSAVISNSAATFTWTKLVSGNASGSWGNQANWSGATLPTTANDTVNFNALDITANSTNSLDGNQSVNTINFADTATGTAANWFINAGSPASSTLTLGGASPTIDVTSLASGKAAVINAVIAGTSGLTKTGTSYLQLNGANTYSGGTVISGYISVGNPNAFGTGTVMVGATPGAGQLWFTSAGAMTLTNAFEIRTIRWIIGNDTVNGKAPGDLTLNGNVLLNSTSVGVNFYCQKNLTINGNVTTTANFPVSMNSGGLLTLGGDGILTLNGSNTISGSFSINAGCILNVNGTMNCGGTVTAQFNSVLTGPGTFSGLIAVANGGRFWPGNSSNGLVTCGGLTLASGSWTYFNWGTTNNSANSFIKVNGNLFLGGTIFFGDLGGLGPGVYPGFQYTGTLTINGLILGQTPAGNPVVINTNTPGYVFFNVLAGNVNPAPGQILTMDHAAPLPLGWTQVSGATAYDAYFGMVSNTVATATTNTAGIYQGRTSALTMNLSSLQPNTTYYWRVDSVAANGAITIGTIYSFTTGAAVTDLMSDTWVATDSLNRSLPGLADCGSPRTNRPIGIFYSLLGTSNTIWGDGGTNFDCSVYLAQNPYTNPHNPWADNPVFQTSAKGGFWACQPKLGYYSGTDPWVLRRHFTMLNEAGIDVVFFDLSQPTTYMPQLLILLNTIEQMKREGTLLKFKIAFFAEIGSASPIRASEYYSLIYALGNYSDLWYYWQGKPLILAEINGGGMTVPQGVRNYFTWRYSWADVPANQLHDGWQWEDGYIPQNWGYDTRSDLPEELPVEPSQSANGNIGKSHCNNSQQDYNNQDLPFQPTSGLGIFFKEQWSYGLKYDPQFLFLTQWNEWLAGAQKQSNPNWTHLLADWCPANGFSFIDQYNIEYNRNLEPINGAYGDNYYYQMVAQNRLRKGVRPVPPASAPQTINLAGGFAQWANVGPGYYDPANDTLWRNFPAGSTQVSNYTNTSGRNDFTVMKVARDANNLYFFAQCNSNLTSYTGTNWMVLFINADQNPNTGWNGYDYAVNLGSPTSRTATTTTLSQNVTTTNGWTWTTVRSDIAYTVSGNQLMLAIPRALLGLTGDPVSFDFHWADNFQTNDIADFLVDGDSAPDGRFNYRYVTTTNTEVTLLSDDFENGKQTNIWAETWTNGSRWTLTTASPYTGNNCAVGSYATSGQSNLIARVSTLGYGSFRLNFHYKLSNVRDAQNLMISYQTTNGWVPIRELSRDEFYPVNQSWSYDEQQNVWLNFADTRCNSGPDARFFSPNFAFRIDVSTLTAAGQQVFVDAVTLTADTQMPAAVSPQVWQTRDIGNAGNAGAVTNTSATFTVAGSGLGIGNTQSDAFRFLYQTRSGDGTLTARVTGITPSSPAALAGVMIRESLDSGARNALMGLTASNSAAFQLRLTALGATTASTLGPNVAPPYWVRVVRSGTNFTGYESANGTTWTQMGSASIAGFNSTALWGLAATANNNNTNTVATFDTVTVVQPPVIAAVNNQTLIAGQTLTITNGIVNPDTPPLTLTWATITAPGGLNINSGSGVLTWRPSIAQSPTTTTISYKVTDSGIPVQSATQSFVAKVNLPVKPTLSSAAATNGTFSLTVNGDNGPDYVLLGTTNLNPPISWQPVKTNLSALPPINFTDPAATNFTRRFYRIQLGP